MACNCDPATLVNNTWVLTDYGPENATIPALDPAAATPPGNGVVTLSFNGNKVNGKDGCNTYFGVFSQSGCSFSVDSINTTLILCQQDIMTQANAYMTILQAAETFSTKNDKLKLCTGDDRVLIYRKQ
ncbi:MAG: hypothetical protein DHS20C18_45010 [Saprospiraceae bacterium]|nr:MAG: hypothetical protein DHS20C18_45010 [Saprospiraceae bacterium]